MTAACSTIESLGTNLTENLDYFLSPLSFIITHPGDLRDRPETDDPSNALAYLIDFLGTASPPSSWDLNGRITSSGHYLDEDADEADPLSFEDCEESIATGKASIIRAVVALSFELEATEDRLAWFWVHMRAWCRRLERDDLVACAFLSFGNVARQGQPVLVYTTDSHRSFCNCPSLRDNLPSSRNNGFDEA